MSTKSMFINGPIPPEMISSSIASHKGKTNIGGHGIFLGQVRADIIDGNTVSAIDFTTNEELAGQVYKEIREEAFDMYQINSAHVFHSRGLVNVGQLCFFVFTSSKRRKMAMEGCEFFVEEIKKRVPIFGKELFEEGGHQWKKNT